VRLLGTWVVGQESTKVVYETSLKVRIDVWLLDTWVVGICETSTHTVDVENGGAVVLGSTHTVVGSRVTVLGDRVSY
jgi:hypothetical protein